MVFEALSRAFSAPSFSHFLQVIVVGRDLKDLFPEWGSEKDHVFGQLLFHVTVTDLAFVVQIAEMIVQLMHPT